MTLQVNRPFKLYEEQELELIEPMIELLYALGPTWENYKTRTANRKYMGISLTGGHDENGKYYVDMDVPKDYEFMKSIVARVVEAATQTIENNDQIIPLQMFVNYYANGDHSTPVHRHGCRQITLSFGCPRVLKVNSKEVTLETGEAIYLNQQRHGVPKLDVDSPYYDCPRISFNLFYSTLLEKNFDIYKK